VFEEIERPIINTTGEPKLIFRRGIFVIFDNLIDSGDLGVSLEGEDSPASGRGRLLVATALCVLHGEFATIGTKALRFASLFLSFREMSGGIKDTGKIFLFAGHWGRSGLRARISTRCGGWFGRGRDTNRSCGLLFALTLPVLIVDSQSLTFEFVEGLLRIVLIWSSGDSERTSASTNGLRPRCISGPRYLRKLEEPSNIGNDLVERSES
jgi:hypothetical protein